MSKLKLLTSLIGIFSVGLVQAETTSSNIDVSTTVTANCIVTANNIALPSFVPGTSSGENSAAIFIYPTCTKGTPYSIALNGGLNASGIDWRMKHSTSEDYLKYYFTTNNVNKISMNIDAYSGEGKGFGGDTTRHYLIAHLPINQNVPFGNYSDTVIITVTY